MQESSQEPDHSSQSRLTEDLDSNTNDLLAQPFSDSVSKGEKPSHVPEEERKQGRDIPLAIFAKNIRPPAMETQLPKADERLSTTPQLAACLCLLKHSQLLEGMLDPPARKWLQSVEKDADEQDRLKILATNVRAFQREEIKDDKVVAEVVCLAPVLEKSDFQYLRALQRHRPVHPTRHPPDD